MGFGLYLIARGCPGFKARIGGFAFFTKRFDERAVWFEDTNRVVNTISAVDGIIRADKNSMGVGEDVFTSSV